ncbi:carbohydrate kinase family protein [Patescibacteria group bacterium]
MNDLDFVAMGDIVTDAFIELKNAEVEEDPKTGKEKLCISFGDKIPYEDVVVVPAVGNSPNASVAAARLGLKSALITNLGDDKFGKEDLEALEKNKIDTSFVKVHEGMKSNYHYVLRFGSERTILIKHQEYPYEMPDIGSPKWLYLSSLGENSLAFHGEIAKYLTEHPEVKLAFQPGTFQMKLGYENLTDIYKLSELFFCNKQEANRILKTNEDNIEVLLENMRDLGPNIVVITDGPDGAYTYDGKEMWHMPIYPDPAPPVDRTGAGDSFSSTFTAALAIGKTIPEALEWAPINSMSVVQHIGAQEGLLTREQLEDHFTKAPDDYKAKQLR